MGVPLAPRMPTVKRFDACGMIIMERVWVGAFLMRITSWGGVMRAEPCTDTTVHPTIGQAAGGVVVW